MIKVKVKNKTACEHDFHNLQYYDDFWGIKGSAVWDAITGKRLTLQFCVKCGQVIARETEKDKLKNKSSNDKGIK